MLREEDSITLISIIVIIFQKIYREICMFPSHKWKINRLNINIEMVNKKLGGKMAKNIVWELTSSWLLPSLHGTTVYVLLSLLIKVLHSCGVITFQKTCHCHAMCHNKTTARWFWATDTNAFCTPGPSRNMPFHSFINC